MCLPRLEGADGVHSGYFPTVDSDRLGTRRTLAHGHVSYDIAGGIECKLRGKKILLPNRCILECCENR